MWGGRVFEQEKKEKPKKEKKKKKLCTQSILTTIGVYN